jgi:thiosulfate dehydrogenase
MEQRLQGCFRYSMNGTPPPADSKTLKSLMSYAYWLASGAPTNTNLPGRGYPKIDKPEKDPDFKRGKLVFEKNCALCHGADGQGTKAGDSYAFPPLWGKNSFNWGAGMHRINTAASFIRANMPLGKGGTLSVQDAWDVAYYLNSHERPQDPRYQGNVAETDKKFHSHNCRYGDKFEGHVLGMKK